VFFIKLYILRKTSNQRIEGLNIQYSRPTMMLQADYSTFLHNLKVLVAT